MAIAALALVMTAGLLAAQPGGWIGAPSGDGGAAVPDAWPLSGDAIFAGLLPGYAFAQSVALNLIATDSITDTTTLELDGAEGIATFTSGGSTYAAVAAYFDDGVQILDITDPSNVTAAGSITGDGTNTDELELNGARGIATFTSGGSTYAAVTAYLDDGVQILDITDPSNVTAAGSITDDGTNTDELELNGARGIATFTSGGSTYAAVTAYEDDGVQILDITDPSNVTAAGSITDDGTNTDELELNGARGIATFKSGGSTYAAVAAYFDDGVQILDITDPSNVTAAGSITDDGTSTDELELNGAQGIATFKSGGSTYAAVAAYDDSSVQILNITNPSNVTAAGSITDGGTLKLDGAWDIAIFKSGGSTYAAVTASIYDGVQILDIADPSNVTAAGNIGDTAALELFGAEDIAIFKSGGSTYAAVAAYFDDGVQILRLSSPPTVMAGSDLIVAEGGTLALSGSATDTDGDAITLYSWSAPPGSGITFADSSLPATTFTAPPVNADVTHTLTLTANDGTDNGTGTIEVTVKETSGAFITTWRTDTAGESIAIPVGGAAGAYDVIWGDGTASTGVTGDQTHTYAVSGDHTVAISGGFERIYLNGHTNATKLASIDQWGSNQWTSMESAFKGASAMTYGATDAPDLSAVTDMANMFNTATSFNGDISGWNVSGVTDMSGMFNSANAFNQTISGWNVSGVTDMSNMFNGAGSFNQPLNDWEVSGVTDMDWMFEDADAFNQNISGWNVSAVTDMSNMFNGAGSFNQPLNDWEVSGVTDMSYMFFSADVFNQNISGWNVSGVTDMTSMFHNAGSFNQPLNDWNVSGVTDMGSMFHGANLFQQNLGKWYVNLNSTEISSAPGIVGGISAQNQELRDQYPKYGIGAGFDESAFEITVDDEEESSLNMTVSPNKRLYRVNVTSESDFGTNNHRILEVTVTGTFDSAAPDPTLSTSAASPTNSASATITVDFGEPIDATTFTLDDISVTGGTASGLAQEGSTTQKYTFTITPSADGEVTASIPADRVTDPASNSNTASNVLRVTFDSTAPSPTLSTDATSPTNAASVTVTVDFGKPIDPTTFTLGDISATGGTASNLAHSSANQNFTFTITPDADGEVTASIPADRVTDPASNSNTASNVLRVTFDSTAPSPTLSTDATSPTNAASVTVTVDFGKPIDPTTFTLGDISATGGTASNLAHSSANQNFTFTITPDADGEVTASIPADRVTDPADNANTASNVLRVTFDSTAPSPTLSTDATSPTNAASVTVTVDFGKPIDPTTFTLGDISATGGTASNLAHSSANQNFTFTITPDADGEVTASIPADRVTDPADNANTASNVLRVTFDSTAPSPTLSTDATSPTNAASVTVTVDFGKPIDPTTFTLGDISATGGTASNLAHSSANQNFTFTITPDADGEVTASIPADRVTDPADNANTASNVLSVTFDRTAPGPTLSTDTTSPTNSASATITVDFGEPIDATTFTLDDISVTGGDASGLAQEGSTTQKYTFTITPDADGEVTASIPADRVADIVGNANTASNILSVVFDRTSPGTTDPTPGSRPNVQCLGYVPYPNNSPVVDVGEDITIAEGETGTLRATVTDMDGDDVETFWVHWKPGTAIITIADPESLVTEFTAPYVDGDTDTYVILHACDGIHTGVGNDVVRITVTDIPEPPEPATPPQLPPPVQEPPVYNEEPSVDAGADFTINEGATGQLSGTATDPDNDQLTMEWLQTPTWPLLTLTDASDPRTTIVAPQVDGDTTITLILSVSDGDYIVPDQVRITIIDTG